MMLRETLKDCRVPVVSSVDCILDLRSDVQNLSEPFEPLMSFVIFQAPFLAMPVVM